MLSTAIGGVTLWRAKRQAETDLAEVQETRLHERLAIEEVFRINDTITVPLIDGSTAGATADDRRKRQSYQELISFYDRIGKTFARGGRHAEVVAKAARRAGALRTAVGDRKGLDDYAHAVDVYEAMIKNNPAAIWYQTGLISTLRESADRLDKLGDAPTATGRRRRAYAVADRLLGDETAKAPCFRKALIPELGALAEMLSSDPGATAADHSLAHRLTVGAGSRKPR